MRTWAGKGRAGGLVAWVVKGPRDVVMYESLPMLVIKCVCISGLERQKKQGPAKYIAFSIFISQ